VKFLESIRNGGAGDSSKWSNGPRVDFGAYLKPATRRPSLNREAFVHTAGLVCVDMIGEREACKFGIESTLWNTICFCLCSISIYGGGFPFVPPWKSERTSSSTFHFPGSARAE